MEGGYKMNKIIEKYDSLDSCPECNGEIILVREEGEEVCVDCGLIINERESIFFFLEELNSKKKIGIN